MGAKPIDDENVEPPLPEVESARLLANEHRKELRPMGLSDDEINRLADIFIAKTKGDPARFVRWALEYKHGEVA